MARKTVHGRAKRQSETSDGAIARLADRAFENPAMSGGLVVMALTASAIISNAMFLQAGRHPEPLFTTRPAPVPQAAPRPAPAVAMAPANIPLPRSRAETVGEANAPEPPAAVGAVGASTSEQVLIADIQRELARLGLYVGAIDGIPGSRTKAAVSAYEAAAGLPVTGETNPALLDSLRNPVEPQMTVEQPTPVAAAPVEPVTTDSVKPAPAADGASDLAMVENERAAAEEQARYFRVQAALNLIGYGPITVDGQAGDQTSNAIRRFELDNGLPVTGTLDDQLIERLIAIGAMQSM